MSAEILWNAFIEEVQKDYGVAPTVNFLGAVPWHKERFMRAAEKHKTWIPVTERLPKTSGWYLVRPHDALNRPFVDYFYSTGPVWKYANVLGGPAYWSEIEPVEG